MALLEFGGPQQIIVTLAGCSDELDQDKPVEGLLGAEAKREYVLMSLLASGIKTAQIEVVWGRGEEALDLYCDCPGKRVVCFSDRL